jgi:hypothetical protein
MPDISPRLFHSPAATDARRIVEKTNLLVHQSRTLMDDARRKSTPFQADDVLATIAHSRRLLDRSARQLRASWHWTAWGRLQG